MKRLFHRNLVTGDDSQLRLPESEYIGFCIGPGSWHSEVKLTGVGADEQIVSVDAPVLLPQKTRCVPEIRHRRVTFQEYRAAAINGTPAGFSSHVEVWGLEHPWELAMIPRARTPWELPTELLPSGTPTNASILMIPFMGRRHAVIYISASTQVDDLNVHGIRWNDPDNATVLAYTTALDVADGTNDQERFPFTATAYTSNVARHIGGTNEEESFDALLVTLGDGTALPTAEGITARAFGELGR